MSFSIGTCTACVAVVLAFAAPSVAQESRFIVKFREGRSADARASLTAAGARVVLTLDRQNAVAAHVPAAALEGLSRNPHIEYIEPDVIREPSALWSNVTSGGETLPYGIQMVQADLVSSPNAGDVRLCIIDSGYFDQHTDLRDFTGTDLTALADDSGSGTWNKDSCGHGTHVAGTVAALAGNGAGVVGANPGVALHIVKVFGNDTLIENGACGWTYSSTLVSALNECVDAGATVVSMSLSGNVRSRTENAAFAQAYAGGVLSIAAAGNAGNGSTGFPAGYESVISVAAVNADEVAASFSQRNRDVEIAAPGVSVLSTVPYLDANTLTTDGDTWEGGRMDGAPRASAHGMLADGGRCTAPGAWANQVVLCQRGDIDFADKVKNVQAGGGVGAAIYNNPTSDPSCGVFTGTLGRRVTTSIPAITLSCADGAEAVALADQAAATVDSAFQVESSGYEAWNGTSMATPHVSAVAALVWSCHPGRTAKDVRDALNASAKDKGAAGRDNVYGYGIVQAKDALTALGGAGSCTVR